MKNKKRFTDDSKKQIVREYENGETIADLCETHNIARSTLYNWIKLFSEHCRYNGKTFSSRQYAKLEQENCKLREENQIYREYGEYIVSSLQKRIELIKVAQEKYSVHALCRVLKVRRSNFYYHLYRSPAKTVYEKRDEKLRPLIQKCFEESKGRFGAEKILVKLSQSGVKTSKRHILKLMREMNLTSNYSSLRLCHSTNRQYKYRRNHLKRNFHQEHPNKVWVSDITYARVNRDYYSICVIIDLFARKVLSWKLSGTNDTELVLQTFSEAFNRRGEPEGLMFHSDQGTQYTSFRFRKFLRDKNVKQSLSIPGQPCDNAVAESFFAVMKREELSHHWYNSRSELENIVAEYIKYFNEMRPHRKNGMLTPDQFEENYFSQCVND